MYSSHYPEEQDESRIDWRPAVATAASQLPHWRKPLSKIPAIACSYARMRIAKTWAPAIRTHTDGGCYRRNDWHNGYVMMRHHTRHRAHRHHRH
jgi:hypothetical protein